MKRAELRSRFVRIQLNTGFRSRQTVIRISELGNRPERAQRPARDVHRATRSAVALWSKSHAAAAHEGKILWAAVTGVKIFRINMALLAPEGRGAPQQDPANE
jgi:hypothetical protein